MYRLLCRSVALRETAVTCSVLYIQYGRGRPVVRGEDGNRSPIACYFKEHAVWLTLLPTGAHYPPGSGAYVVDGTTVTTVVKLLPRGRPVYVKAASMFITARFAAPLVLLSNQKAK